MVEIGKVDLVDRHIGRSQRLHVRQDASGWVNVELGVVEVDVTNVVVNSPVTRELLSQSYAGYRTAVIICRQHIPKLRAALYGDDGRSIEWVEPRSVRRIITLGHRCSHVGDIGRGCVRNSCGRQIIASGSSSCCCNCLVFDTHGGPRIWCSSASTRCGNGIVMG